MEKIARQTTIVVGGLDELRDMLINIAPRQANNILRNTVNGIAGKVRDEMKRRVPVDHGNLKKSIKVVRRRGYPNFPISEVRIGHDAPYGLMVEFGTSKTHAHPYIVPTVESMRPTLTKEYREEFGEKLEKALAKRAKKARR